MRVRGTGRPETSRPRRVAPRRLLRAKASETADDTAYSQVISYVYDYLLIGGTDGTLPRTKEVPMKKLLTTLMLTAFMASGTAAMAGAAAEKDTKAGKDKPAAKEEKSAPAPKADDKAAGDKKEKK